MFELCKSLSKLSELRKLKFFFEKFLVSSSGQNPSH